MGTKHTPGKWHVFKIYNGKDSWENASYDVGIYSDTGGAKIATVETWIGKAESIECDANADLIAQAPDLLAERDRLRHGVPHGLLRLARQLRAANRWSF